MSREVVTRWFNSLGEVNKDLPLLIVGGFAYTPRATLDEVNRGTAVGAQLQTLIETGRLGTTSLDEKAVAIVRIQQRFATYPQNKPIFATLSNKTFTPSELLAEIDAGTQIGQQYLNSEIQQMHTLLLVK